MRLSRKSEYALLALISLAKSYNNKLMTITQLSKQNEIPQKYLEQILVILKRSGYVRSVRGPKGGYKLAKSPNLITLAEIVRSIDGPLAPVNSTSVYYFTHTPIEKNKNLHKIFKEIRDYVSSKLENTTLKDLL